MTNKTIVYRKCKYCEERTPHIVKENIVNSPVKCEQCNKEYTREK